MALAAGPLGDIFVARGDAQRFVEAAGSPGGPLIINYVAKVLVGTLDWDLNMQQAIALPNFGSRNGPTELEAGRFPAAEVEALKARGHKVDVINDNYQDFGAGQFIWRAGDPKVEGYVCASDSRRDGLAAGF